MADHYLPPVTLDSIMAAKLAAYLERFDVWCKTGVEIRADGTVVLPDARVPMGPFDSQHLEVPVGVRLGRAIR